MRRMVQVDIESGSRSDGTYWYRVFSMPDYTQIAHEEGFDSWEDADDAAEQWLDDTYGRGSWDC